MCSQCAVYVQDGISSFIARFVAKIGTELALVSSSASHFRQIDGKHETPSIIDGVDNDEDGGSPPSLATCPPLPLSADQICALNSSSALTLHSLTCSHVFLHHHPIQTTPFIIKYQYRQLECPATNCAFARPVSPRIDTLAPDVASAQHRHQSRDHIRSFD